MASECGISQPVRQMRWQSAQNQKGMDMEFEFDDDLTVNEIDNANLEWNQASKSVEKHLGEYDWEGALAELDVAEGLLDKYPRAYSPMHRFTLEHCRGDTHWEMGELEKACESLRRAKEGYTNPPLKMVHKAWEMEGSIAILLFQMGRYQEARESVEAQQAWAKVPRVSPMESSVKRQAEVMSPILLSRIGLRELAAKVEAGEASIEDTGVKKQLDALFEPLGDGVKAASEDRNKIPTMHALEGLFEYFDLVKDYEGAHRALRKTAAWLGQFPRKDQQEAAQKRLEEFRAKHNLTAEA